MDQLLKRRVVIAEDEALIRLDLAEMLAEEGFDVVGQAGDGAEAVAMANGLRPDLVILDVRMPTRDGISAATEIAGSQMAPVIMLTAFSDRDMVQQAVSAGAAGFLCKPVSKASLVPAIEMAIARHAQTAVLRAQLTEAADRLKSGKFIDRAKGLLMAHHGLSEPEAFRWLQRTAAERNRSVPEIASAVIEKITEATTGRAHG